MEPAPTPFAAHPELRDKIADPLTSFFRTFSAEVMLARFPQLESAKDWIHPDDVREATRRHCLADHGTGDLWIFAYGSLMWDPAVRFTDVRRAHVPDYARRFILKDVNGGRGTQEIPGLMAALDAGCGCEGLAFRIAAAEVETETEILWRREMIGPGYVPAFVPALIDGQHDRVLTFLADHAAPAIDTHLSRAEQVHLIARSEGFLGTSKAYLENIVTQFAHLGIVDAECSSLLQEVEEYIAKS